MYPTLNYFLQLTRNMKNVYSFICALTLPFFTNKRQSSIIVFEVKESMVIFGFAKIVDENVFKKCGRRPKLQYHWRFRTSSEICLTSKNLNLYPTIMMKFTVEVFELKIFSFFLCSVYSTQLMKKDTSLVKNLDIPSRPEPISLMLMNSVIRN